MNFIKKSASFVKIEHTLFSLPLLFAGALLVPGPSILKYPPWGRLGWIVLAGTGARTAALALNRLIDRQIDARNPRTAGRELPAGKLKLWQAWAIFGLGTIIYIAAATALGPTCLALSPLPLLVFAVYPLMKRFTWLAHFGVGLGLALAPLGGYVGMAGALPSGAGAWCLAAFTFCWVAGFDALYACLDEDFDRKEGLHSIPSHFGKAVALNTGLTLHILALLFLISMRWTAFSTKPEWIWAALAPAGILLALEQNYGYSLDKDSPFFKINAWIGVAVFGYACLGAL